MTHYIEIAANMPTEIARRVAKAGRDEEDAFFFVEENAIRIGLELKEGDVLLALQSALVLRDDVFKEAQVPKQYRHREYEYKIVPREEYISRWTGDIGSGDDASGSVQDTDDPDWSPSSGERELVSAGIEESIR